MRVLQVHSRVLADLRSDEHVQALAQALRLMQTAPLVARVMRMKAEVRRRQAACVLLARGEAAAVFHARATGTTQCPTLPLLRAAVAP
jgi:predicted dienelactone hydrolase